MPRLAYARAPYAPTRFPKGITNANIGENLANLAMPDPSKMQTIFEDFMVVPTEWVNAVAIAGAGGLVTVATTLQMGTPLACFNLANANRQFFLKTRLSLATVANSISIGFADNLATPTAGVTLTIANNLATLQTLGGTPTLASVAVATVNATMYELGFAYTPDSGVTAYLDTGTGPVAILRVRPTTFTATNLVAAIRPSGATATVDYVFASVER